MKALRIGANGFHLPAEVLSDVTAIVGRRGRGKTSTAVVMVEEAHRLGRRFCVLDPTDVWWGLRSSRSGTDAGIPCVVFGGRNQMAALEPTSGKLLAEFVADPTQPSAVLSIKTWSRGEQIRFAADFLATLYQKNTSPLLLVLDEADQFAPQSREANESVMLGAAQRLVKLGRASGFGVVAVTQRPASLNKNVMNMAGILVAHGLTGPQDHDAVFSWMKHRADEKKGEEILGSLPGLDVGEAWVWAPELDVLKRVQVRQRDTFDSSFTPKHGEKLAQPRAVAEVDLDKLSKEIKATVERMKAEDPRELRKQLAEERALGDKLRKAIDQKVAEMVTRADRLDAIAKAKAPKPVAALKDAQIKRLEALVERLGESRSKFTEAQHALEERLHAWDERVAAEMRAIHAALAAAQTRPPNSGRNADDGAGQALARARPAPVVSRAPVAARRPEPGGNGDGLDAGAQRVLDTVAMLNLRGLPVTREAVARWMGIHPNGGRYNRTLARLREEGQLEGFRLTAIGAEALLHAADGRPIPIPTGVEGLLAALPDASHRRVMEAILEVPGSTREELAARLGIHPNGGRYNRTLAWLRTMGVIPERGAIVAVEGVYR
jgi:hypothetical protein